MKRRISTTESKYHGRWNGKKIRLVGKEKDKDQYNTIIFDKKYTDITIEAHEEIES